MSNVCRICLKFIRHNNFCDIIDSNYPVDSSFRYQTKHLTIKDMIMFCMPEIVLNCQTINRLVICLPCLKSLSEMYEFKRSCVLIEKMILYYIEFNNGSINTEIDLKDVASMHNTGYTLDDEIPLISNSIEITSINTAIEPIYIIDKPTQRKTKRSSKTSRNTSSDIADISVIKNEAIDIKPEVTLEEGIESEECVTDEPSSQSMEDPPLPQLFSVTMNDNNENDEIDEKLRRDENKVWITENYREDDSDVESKSYGPLLEFQCDTCFKILSNSRSLNIHKNSHAGKRPFKCQQCNKSYVDRSTLTKHIRIHGERKFPCDGCDSKFFDKGSLNKHIRTHTGDRPFNCEVCKKTFIRSEHLKKHMFLHTGERPHECELCSRRFNRKSCLQVHMNIHRNVTPYVCEVCDKRFHDRSTMIKHCRVHTGEKPYSCQICLKTYKQKSHLNEHVLRHNASFPQISDLPHECEICQKRFRNRHNLVKHSRIHTGEKPYECDICLKRFLVQGNMILHRKRHSGERPFTCGICDKSFIMKNELKKHVMVHSGEKPYPCMICSKRFSRKVRAKQHAERMHPHFAEEMRAAEK